MKKWKCTVCGYIYSGEEKPEKCPACGVGAENLVEVEASGTDLANKQALKEEEPKEEQAASGGSQKKWKCTVCNYIHEGEDPPEKCPVCGAGKSFFVEVTDDDPAQEVASDEKPSSPGKGSEFPVDIGFLGGFVMRHHLHPITVHTPNGVLPVAILFLLGGVFFSVKSLEFASLLNLVVVLLSMPAVAYTGYACWLQKYRGAKTPVFKIKMFCALVVAVAVTLMICWRLIDSAVPLAGTTGSWVYLGLGFIALTAAGIAGHLGGKLVFDK